MPQQTPYPTRDFSDRELKWSIFFVRYVSLFKKIGVGALMAIDLVFVLLFLKGIYTYYITYSATEAAIAQIDTSYIDWPSVRAAIGPKPIVAGGVTILQGAGASDFVAEVENSNARRWGSFEYRYTWSSGSTSWTPSFLMPNSRKHLVALGNEGDAPAVVQLEIQNVVWNKLTSELSDRLLVTRDGVAVLESTFVPNVNEELTGVPNSGVVFTVENRSPFDVVNVPFTILVHNGISVTAVNRATVSRLDQGESRIVRTRWFRSIGGGELIIEPDINFLDDASLAPVQNLSDETF